MRVFLLLLLLLLVSLSLSPLASASASSDEALVRIESGLVQGAVTPDGLALAWRGIPFAAPPVGDLRWVDPQPVTPWNDTVLTADDDSMGCVQKCELPPFACAPNITEDCLYLNVFTPRNAPHSKGQLRPVVVYLYGGNYFQGAMGSAIYDGRWWANHSDTVVVVPNYRLGVLGFASTTTVSGGGFAGNYGLNDQVFAMEWVQRNILRFGGDPNRVTLGGQSAGSSATGLHLVYPPSRGLFHQAFMWSNPIALPLRTNEEWDLLESTMAKGLGCASNDTACLRAAPADAVLAVQSKLQTDLLVNLGRPLELFMPFTPTTNTSLLPEQPMAMLLSGQFEQMPVFVGNTAQEAVLFVYEAFPKPVKSLEYALVLDLIFGLGKGGKVAARYPCANADDCRMDMSRAATDGIFLCANRNVTRTISSLPPERGNLYYYLYDHPASDHGAWGNDSFCYNVSCHGGDIPEHWHSYSYTTPPLTATPDEAALSVRMASYMTNFIHTGDPNTGPTSAGLLAWPAYSNATQQSMHYKTPADRIDTRFNGAACDWWDSEMGYVWP